jgi:hypothetical protein
MRVEPWIVRQTLLIINAAFRLEINYKHESNLPCQFSEASQNRRGTETNRSRFSLGNASTVDISGEVSGQTTSIFNEEPN